jgi:hypothetical protein
MTSPNAVLSAEALAAYDSAYRLGKAAGVAENDELRARLDGYRRFTWPDGITEDAAEAAQRLWVALEEVRAISAAHHGEQPMAVLLHALTVDIPARVDAALFADGWCGCGHHISEHGHRPGYRDGCAAFLNGIDDSNGRCVCRAFSIAPGLAEGALRRETPDGAPNDTLDALTAHAQRTGEYDEMRAARDELEALFDLRYAADMRAIARWREGHPERALKSPDHADLVVWLLNAQEHFLAFIDMMDGATTETLGGRVPEAADFVERINAAASLIDTLRTDRDRLTARVAELEAERDRWREEFERACEAMPLYIGGLRWRTGVARVCGTPEPTESEDA